MLRLASPLASLSVLPVLVTILSTPQITSSVAAISRDDIPSQCYDQCDGSISMLNSCGLDTDGSNKDKDNSACFCQNMSKSNYKDCATCIRNNQGDYTNTNYDGYTTTTYYDNNNNNDYDNNNNDYDNNNNNYNQDYNNNNDYDNNDYNNNNDYDDNDNDYKKRAVPFGKPTPAPGVKKARGFKGKRGILDDLLNLDGLVCTVNGVVSDVGEVVGDVTSLANSLVTEVLDGRTTTYTWGDRNRDYDPRPTTIYQTVTDNRNSAQKVAGGSAVMALSFVALAIYL